MTIEEKLKHFQNYCIEDANLRANKIISDYQTALEKTFSEHKLDEERRANLKIKIETEQFKRELNKIRSIEELKLKKLVGDKRSEITDKIFLELKDKIENFMSSTKYYDLLDKQIKEAISFADGDILDIYIDPNDAHFINKLSIDNIKPNSNVSIKESKYSFMGGTRAVIVNKNILIDKSFEKAILEAKKNFHIHIGGAFNE